MAYVKKSTRSADWNYGGPKWRLSRSKIDLFMQCPRCFYIDNKLGVARPKLPSFNLNIAVDGLLKKEFDIHRAAKTAHPLMKTYGVDAVPFVHKNMGTWRENFEGIEFLHEATRFRISGAVDDIWVNPKGGLIIVDYKATSKDGKLDELDDTQWHDQYRRQMEIYQWLYRHNGFEVSDTGYFVYVNGKKDKDAFDGKLEFDVTLIPYKGDDSWVEGILFKIKECLEDDRVPQYSSPDKCDYCKYLQVMGEVLRDQAKKPGVEKEEKTLVKKPKLAHKKEDVQSGPSLF